MRRDHTGAPPLSRDGAVALILDEIMSLDRLRDLLRPAGGSVTLAVADIGEPQL